MWLPLIENSSDVNGPSATWSEETMRRACSSHVTTTMSPTWEMINRMQQALSDNHLNEKQIRIYACSYVYGQVNYSSRCIHTIGSGNSSNATKWLGDQVRDGAFQRYQHGHGRVV